MSMPGAGNRWNASGFPVWRTRRSGTVLATLLQAGIRDILVIIPPGEEREFQNLLGDGSELGLHIELWDDKKFLLEKGNVRC